MGRGGKKRGRALLFDHVLVDHGGDDGQGDDAPGRGQNLRDLFVLERRRASGHPGARGNSAGNAMAGSAWPLLGSHWHPTSGGGLPSGESRRQTPGEALLDRERGPPLRLPSVNGPLPTLASRASHLGLTEQGLTNRTTLLPSPTEAPHLTSHISYPISLGPKAGRKQPCSGGH